MDFNSVTDKESSSILIYFGQDKKVFIHKENVWLKLYEITQKAFAIKLNKGVIWLKSGNDAVFNREGNQATNFEVWHQNIINNETI